ncbi:MAG: hypothetical protein RQ875_10765 [Vicingaceae bacterium]|nr:hypothetical protein [Vicingaceae bacterium]
MTNLEQMRQQEIIEKQNSLTKTKAILKKEFIGIDIVIEQVIDALSSWYMFPEMQEKPVIINLWGLTGVGKSSLVNRISELIGYQKKYYHFDLGEGESKEWQIKKQLEEIYEHVNGYPVLIALDEIQHARTINEQKEEIEKSSSRIIWQLLDSGKFQIRKYNYKIDDLYDLIIRLKFLLRMGVEVSSGMVVSGKDLYLEHMKSKDEDGDKKFNDNMFFIPTSMHEDIYELAKELFETPFDVKTKLLDLNGKETIMFLHEVYIIANSPKEVDCSKGLIFVLGNLDEAYSMSNDFNPDMDANEFHEQSLKINLPTIKKALKKRFRNEQIARFGNIHIIYPAFSSSSFKQIIKLELSKISNQIKNHQKITLQFDNSVHQLIYTEGVYPTQGTRPIFTTIHQLVKSQFGKIFSELYLKQLSTTKIVLNTQGNNLVVKYVKNQSEVHTIKIPLQLSLEKLRKNKKDDVQAITAVHEAGHAVLSVALMNTIPEVIYSNSTEVNTGGFVYTKFNKNFVSKKEITKLLAVYLGGRAAEKVIFGEENVTTGAEEDIKKATNFIMEMLKNCGMGNVPAAYHIEDASANTYINDYNNQLNKEAERWINEAFNLAENTLKKEEQLLLKIAEYLSNNRKMEKRQIAQMVKKYTLGLSLEILKKENETNFYRQQLVTKIKSLNTTPKNKKNITTFDFSLNNKLNTDC